MASTGTAQEPMTRKRVTHSQITDLWTRHEPKWKAYWDRIDRSRHALRGGVRFQFPEGFQVPERDSMIISLPQKAIVPMQILSLLGRPEKTPRAKRNPSGASPRSVGQSSNVETWVDSVMRFEVDGRPLADFLEIIGRIFLDGACVVIVLPSTAHSTYAPDWVDSLTEEEYAKLGASRRKQYRDVVELDLDDFQATQNGRGKYVKVDADGEPIPRRVYQRDNQGRAPDHPYYEEEDADGNIPEFSEDRKRTRRAYGRHLKHWLARRLPFEVRVLNARDCIPIFSEGERLEGMLIRRKFDTEELIDRDFAWGEKMPMLEEQGEEGSSGNELTLYEYWGKDRDGGPYVAYSVEGADTHFRGKGPLSQARAAADSEDEVEAVIDLGEEFGMSRMPVRWCVGSSFPGEAPWDRPVPFLHPIMGAISGAEALATAMLVRAYREAFTSKGIHIDPQVLERFPELLIGSDNQPKSYSIQPMKYTILPGRPYDMTDPGAGGDTGRLLELLLDSTSALTPADSAWGGGGASSGHDRALSREYVETSKSLVRQAALSAWKFIAECLIEFGVTLHERTGRPVPVYANVRVPQSGGEVGRTDTQRKVVELRASWIGEIYDLEVFYPKSEGEDIALREQLAQQHLQGLVPWDEFRERAWGDEHPMATLAKIFTDQALRTPEGRSEIMEFAAELWGSDLEEQRKRLVKEGRLTPTGTPTAMLVPRDPAVGPAGIPPDQGGTVMGPDGPITIPPEIMEIAKARGIPPELLGRHMQLDASHRLARQAGQPSGPLGPIQGAPDPTAQLVPPGVAGPVGPAGPGLGAEAPVLAGMGIGPTMAERVLGGVMAGAKGTGARRYHAARQVT